MIIALKKVVRELSFMKRVFNLRDCCKKVEKYLFPEHALRKDFSDAKCFKELLDL